MKASKVPTFSERRNASLTAKKASPCQTCGACCSYSREWPRFTTETDADVARIASELIDDDHWRLRCIGDRCAALTGDVGVATACAIYAVRPEVCRACEPADDACQMARAKFGLPPAQSSQHN